MQALKQAMTVEVDGAHISFEDQGTGGPALLFMPGWCGSRRVFDELVAECSTHRRTLAMDLRGHGDSSKPVEDFDATQLVWDALALIEASGAEQVIPVALSHAGWIGIELRRRLGHRIPKMILLDWIILDPPPAFLGALQGLQSPTQWAQTRDQLFAMWLHDLRIPELTSYVQEDMGSYDAALWARAGREISAAYAEAGSPLSALAQLDPPVPVLHMYAQPDDPGYLGAQQTFSAAHPWFQVRKLAARSHFPMLEVPHAMAAAIEEFIR
jgi:pimeloyl-ACP methyl ester carboxylesterase